MSPASFGPHIAGSVSQHIAVGSLTQDWNVGEFLYFNSNVLATIVLSYFNVEPNAGVCIDSNTVCNIFVIPRSQINTTETHRVEHMPLVPYADDNPSSIASVSHTQYCFYDLC